LLATAPLWPGVVPFGIAFAILARASGFSGVETQAMSMLVFAGSAQLALVTLYASGAGLLAIVLTTLVLNLRHVLYGLSVNRLLRDDPAPAGGRRRSALAFLLTDEAYGVALRARLAGRGGASFLLGAGLGLYLVWSLATLAGLLFGTFLPDAKTTGIAFIFPLSFVALLLPLVRTRLQLLVALIAAGTALAAVQLLGSGLAILLAAVTAAASGALLERRPAEG
jgi:4-azaleucine resistance transporter AzlC